MEKGFCQKLEQLLFQSEIYRSDDPYSEFTDIFEEMLLLLLFLTATWLPHGQLWATVEGAASLTRC